MDWDKIRTPEDIIDLGKKKFGDSRKFIPMIIAVVVLIIGSLLLNTKTSFLYSIGPQEVGVVQRFGKYIRLSTPGLHAKIPFGIENVTPVKVTKVFTEEFGFRTVRPGVRTQYSSRKHFEESLMLTGDLNIVDVRWIVQYKVSDPVKALFNVRGPEENIRDVSEAIMRELVGDYRVDEVISAKREEINHFAQQQMQKVLDSYNSGIDLNMVRLQDVNPPDKVKPAFNEVNEAKQEKEKLINQAKRAYNEVIPKARGEAEKTIKEAEGYGLDKINRAKGESERFLSVLAEYKKAPDITRKRLYLETLAEVLPNAKNKYIIDAEESSILPLLQLGKKGGAE